MVHADVALEATLAGSAFATPSFSESFGGGEWVDITTECRAAAPIVLEYGTFSDDPTDLVSGAGSLSFALNNADSNAAKIRGWYSPLHAQKRGGFDFNIPVRLRISDGVTNSYKFAGRLADILVEPGVHENKLVHCTALDLMDDYGRLPVPPLTTQFNKRGDELINQILSALPAELQPTNQSIETGLETHAIAFDRAEEESQTIREAINDICASEMATAGFIGTTAPGGGLFAFRNRQNPVFSTLVLHHFETDIKRGGLEVPGSRDDLVSRVQVFVHPTRVDTSPVVLYALQTTSTLVDPGATNDTLFGPYRDPANPGDRVGGTAMIQPVATTDYTMNTAQDGSGTDVTADFTVSASYTGNGVRFTIVNNGGVAAYITKLQARGNGIYRFTAVIERDVPNVAYGHRVMQVEMPYQNNVNTGNDVADYLTNVLSKSLSRVRSISFYANANATLLGAMLVGEPGRRFSITEEMTGLNATEFIINGVRLEIRQASRGLGIWCTWYPKPADMQRYWVMDQLGADALEDETVLGY